MLTPAFDPDRALAHVVSLGIERRLGTAVFVSPNVLATCAHVIRDAPPDIAILFGGSYLPATVMGMNSPLPVDVAFLSLVTAPPIEPQTPRWRSVPVTWDETLTVFGESNATPISALGAFYRLPGEQMRKHDHGADRFEVSPGVTTGFSGGVAVDCANHVVGMVVAFRDFGGLLPNTTVVLGTETVATCLAKIVPDVALQRSPARRALKDTAEDLIANYVEAIGMFDDALKSSPGVFLLHGDEGMGKSLILRHCVRHRVASGTTVVSLDASLGFSAADLWRQVCARTSFSRGFRDRTLARLPTPRCLEGFADHVRSQAGRLLISIDTGAPLPVQTERWLLTTFLAGLARAETCTLAMTARRFRVNPWVGPGKVRTTKLAGIPSADQWLPVVDALGIALQSYGWLEGVCAGTRGHPEQIRVLLHEKTKTGGR